MMTFYLRKIIEKRLGAALGRTPKKQQRECLTVSTQKVKFSIKKSFHESPFLLVITSPCKMYLFRQAPFENIILLYSGRNVLIIIEKKNSGQSDFYQQHKGVSHKYSVDFVLEIPSIMKYHCTKNEVFH